MTPTLNPALRDFWSAREIDGRQITTRVLYGGRMSSKSWDAAGVAIARANFRHEVFLCTRMYQNRISDSVYTLLKKQIDRFGLTDKFTIFADAIEHKTNGSLFRFYGVARNADEIKSFEGATIGWFEEAHNLTQDTYIEIIRPTIIRNDEAEMWITFNPKFESDFVYQHFVVNPPPGTIVRKINYDENPFLPASALQDIEDLREADPELYGHVYLGIPKQVGDKSIINRAWIEAAIDAHKKLPDLNWAGRKTIGFDVADDGDDMCANGGLDGSIIIFLDEWTAGEDELLESTNRTKTNAMKLGADQIGYDCIGVGASVGAMLTDKNWRAHYKFNAAAKVLKPDKNYGATKIKNKDFFSNLKAQAWWLLAERFKNTYLAITKGREFSVDQMISIDSQSIPKRLVDKLVTELSTPHEDYDNQGKVKVESKKDLLKRNVKSPNLADAVIIASSRSMLVRPSLSDIL